MILRTLRNLVTFTIICCLSAAAAVRPELNPSEALKAHPCFSALIPYVSAKLSLVNAHNGTVAIDSLANLVPALEAAEVPHTLARAIGEEYQRFRDNKIQAKSIRRLAAWMDRWEKQQSPPGSAAIPGPMRSVICVPDLNCSISDPPNNYTFYPNPHQIILIAPAPKPEVEAQPYVDALLSGISVAQGESVFKEWLQAVATLRASSARWKDPYAEKFVVDKQRYSLTFEVIALHLHSILIRADLIRLANPALVQKRLQWIAEGTLPEIAHYQWPDTGTVLEAIGLRDWRDVFRVAEEIMDQIERTNSLAANRN